MSRPDPFTARRMNAALLLMTAIALAACGKSTPEMPTAARVKQVEERQRTDPNFFLKEKSVPTPAVPARGAVADSANTPGTATPGTASSSKQ